MEKINIETTLLRDIVVYLSKRPYNEVASLVQRLLVVSKEAETETNKTSTSKPDKK